MLILFAMQHFNEGSYTYYVYILTNKHRNTFYIGVINNLKVRLQQHLEAIKNKTNTFVARYSVGNLVYYEKFSWIHLAIEREKELKNWKRERKIELIRSYNYNFEFLNDRFIKE